MHRPGTSRRLVADIGGTHTRLAIHDPVRDEFRHQQLYENHRFHSLQLLISDWALSHREPLPATGCLAVAARIRGDQVSMTNRDWSFSCHALAEKFSLQALAVLNDFEAHAYALPWLRDEDLLTLQAGPQPQAAEALRRAVIGPGTGLGGAVLDHHESGPKATACEPGHMNLAPSAGELALWTGLLAEHGRVSVELLLSGEGLSRLRRALAAQSGVPAERLEPAEITARALAGGDRLCENSVATFCALLGGVCGDFLLAAGAWGGLYLAGGILPRLVPLLRSSPFLQRFHQHGPLTSELQEVPVWLITHPSPGLVGAAHAPIVPVPGKA